MFKAIQRFLSEVKAEFRKVTWPTKDQTIKQTGVVLFITLVTSLFLGAIDMGLSELAKRIIG